VGSLEIIKLLLNVGVDASARGSFRVTALEYASLKCNVETVRPLLELEWVLLMMSSPRTLRYYGVIQWGSDNNLIATCVWS